MTPARSELRHRNTNVAFARFGGGGISGVGSGGTTGTSSVVVDISVVISVTVSGVDSKSGSKSRSMSGAMRKEGGVAAAVALNTLSCAICHFSLRLEKLARRE